MPGWGQEDKKPEKPRGPPSGWSGCWDENSVRPSNPVGPSSIADLLQETGVKPAEGSQNPVYHKPEENGSRYGGK